MILYADILFLIDFSMDVLTLWTAGRLTHSPLKLGRLCSASFFSALVTVVATALSPSRATTLIIEAILPAAMCLIAFGRARASVFIRRYILLWLGGLLLGGCMTLLIRQNTSVGYSSSSPEGNPAVLMLAGAFAATFLVKTLSRTPSASFREVTLRFRRHSLTLRGMRDSGNLLTDPFTGEPVIIIRADMARELFTSEEYASLVSDGNIPSSLAGRTRLIPAKGISGEILLRAVRPDKITFNGSDYRALIALSDKLSVSDCDAVLPSSFF